MCGTTGAVGSSSTSTAFPDDETSSSGDAHDPSLAFDVLYVPDVGAAVCEELLLDAAPVRVPTDLIIAVDGSGSMVEEAAAVEAHLQELVEHMNTQSVDLRVVLLARASGSTGICIDAPVGSGQCPDDGNEPAFRHIDVDIGSWEPLRAIVDHFPLYADLLRPEARRQLVVVSDDNAFDLGADAFMAEFTSLDPWNDGFVFHGLATQSPCASGVSPGTEYQDLAQQTGGTLGDLCGQDFGMLFESLAEGAASASHGCVYPLDAISGWPEDPDRATLSVGGVPLEQVESPGECAPGGQGWFVAGPSLHLCPASCDRVRAMDSPTLDIDVACGLTR